MEKNVGLYDRITRGVIAVILVIVSYLYGQGVWEWVLYIIAAVLAVTAIVGHCCLYHLVKADTTKECSCCCEGSCDDKKTAVSEKKPAQKKAVKKKKR